MQARHYAYLNTRVSILAQQLLSQAQFQRLIDAPAEQQGALLRQAGVGFLSDPASQKPESLERDLITAVLADYTVLLRPLSGPERSFLLYWMRVYELANLRVIIRGKLAGQGQTLLRTHLVDLGRFATLPLDELLSTEDVAELLRRLQRTAFVGVARVALRVFTEQRGVFALVATLEQHYINGLITALNVLERQERALLIPLIGGIVDHTNLVWLLRYRFGYGLSPAEAYYLLISGGYRLNAARLRQLAQLSSFELVLEALPPALATVVTGAQNTTQVERLLEGEIVAVAAGLLKSAIFTLARAVAYLALRERQLLRLHSILKGRHLQLDIHDIRDAAGFTTPSAQSALAGATRG